MKPRRACAVALPSPMHRTVTAVIRILRAGRTDPGDAICPRAAGAIAAVSLLLTGCTSLYTLQVESTRQPATSRNTDAVSYQILNFSETATPDGNTLRQKEAEKIIRDALAVRGMYPAPNQERADILLDVQYGVAPAKIDVHDVKQPVVVRSGDPVAPAQLIGYRHGIEARVVQEKYLRITARKNVQTEDGKAPPVLWAVSVKNPEEGVDLRKCLPILAEVASQWSDRNSNGTRSFTATLENGVLVYVSGGYDQPGIAPELQE